MKIVKILGGLGNQMFQYALYLALKERFPGERVTTDVSCFKGYPLHNGFEVDEVFALRSPAASPKEVLKVAWPYPNYRCWQIGKYLLPKRRTMCVERKDGAYDATVLTQAGDRYYDGYWQNEAYFRGAGDAVRKAFAFPPAPDGRNREAAERFRNAESVSVHVRRGDYVNHPLYRGICGPDYYKRATDCLNKRTSPQLYAVFSNDIPWCESHLSGLWPNRQVVYVDWNRGRQSYLDMQLIGCCKHHIIANSSFSWWGAWLNPDPDKTVIAPGKWLNTNPAQNPVPEGWIKL